MFGPRLSTVFASRWRALWFAAAVMGTAYCTIPGAHDDETSGAAAQGAKAAIASSDLSQDEKAQLNDVLNQLETAGQQ